MIANSFGEEREEVANSRCMVDIRGCGEGEERSPERYIYSQQREIFRERERAH